MHSDILCFTEVQVKVFLLALLLGTSEKKSNMSDFIQITPYDRVYYAVHYTNYFDIFIIFGSNSPFCAQKKGDFWY